MQTGVEGMRYQANRCRGDASHFSRCCGDALSSKPVLRWLRGGVIMQTRVAGMWYPANQR